MADWAGMQQRGFIDGGGWDRCHAKQTPAVRQLIFAATVGEPAEVPDLYKPRRKDMLQEAAQKLHGADRHYAYLISPVVPPAEAHLAPLEGDEPRVRNGDAVRVAGEIFQSLLRPAEGRLGIAWNKPPILIFSTLGKALKCAGLFQICAVAEKGELSSLVGLSKEREKLAAEQAAQDAHGKSM